MYSVHCTLYTVHVKKTGNLVKQVQCVLYSSLLYYLYSLQCILYKRCTAYKVQWPIRKLWSILRNFYLFLASVSNSEQFEHQWAILFNHGQQWATLSNFWQLWTCGQLCLFSNTYGISDMGYGVYRTHCTLYTIYYTLYTYYVHSTMYINPSACYE